MMFSPTLIHCRRPKVQCPHCGSVQVSAPFERKSSHFTLQFESCAMMLLADMPIYKTAALLRCDEKSMSKIMRAYKAVDAAALRDAAKPATDRRRPRSSVAKST
jgi:transposase